MTELQVIWGLAMYSLGMISAVLITTLNWQTIAPYRALCSLLSFLYLLMEPRMIRISEDQVQQMLTQLHRAEGYCSRAKSTPEMTVSIVDDDPTLYYPGASGYAGATMRSIICTLETHL